MFVFSTQHLSNTVMVLAVLAIGLGFFLFNMFQARAGWSQMKRLQRARLESDANFARDQELIDQISALTQEFVGKTIGLSATERSSLWKPVGEALDRSITARLALNSSGAERELRTAIAAAKRILAAH